MGSGERVMIGTINMTKARAIHRENIRRALVDDLQQNTAEYLDALARGNDTTAIAAARVQMEDAVTNPAIDSAATVGDLMALWNTGLLGPSPYPEP
jgi:hypothetical protein